MAKAVSDAPWAKPVKEVLSDLAVDPSQGLSEEAASKRLAQFGPNELTKDPPTPLWKLIAEQFDDTLVKILLASAGVSFGLAYFDEESQHEGWRAYVEPFVIVLILILNAAVGVWQESRSEAALEALKELQSEHARVLRGGKLISELPARELVPGDVVELHVGDRVPADIRVVTLRTATVRAEQASLTGESVAVSKTSEPMPERDCELQAKENMLFAGTAIANGTVIGVVTSTGMLTEIGKIQSQIKEASDEEDETPLKKKLNQFGDMLAQVIFWICVLVWLINFHNYLTFEMLPNPPFGLPLPNLATIKVDVSRMVYYLKIAVALAVAAIPEGLPAVITTCLALGTRTMAKKNAIVRKLPSVETLGCTTVICSDKTGTLTTNQMSAVQLSLVAAGGKDIRTWTVTGHTYNPSEGAVEGDPALDKGLVAAAEICAVCNEATIEFKNGAFRAVGAPTEAALRVLVEKLAGDKLVGATPRDYASRPEPTNILLQDKLPLVSLLEFDRDRKSMSVLAATPAGGNVLLVKGAAECVLERSTKVLLPDGSVAALTPQMRAVVLAQVEAMAAKALRCLALAQKAAGLGPLGDYNKDPKHPGHKLLANPAEYSRIESELVFVGLVGLQDPPRPEVKDAISECRQAGIRVIVITGDNKKTAEAICEAIGVLRPGDDLTDRSFTGREFSALAHSDKVRILKQGKGLVFSRAEPGHKQDIVRALKELGEVAAMTGDGVNDAPALKLADIGIAMGISGTEVAKEASDMVLADDNFSTIVAAVSEGRSIYNNMKAFIRYMISSNIGEVASIFLTAALGLPEGLIPVQLLWVNLVTDGPPATALGFNKPDKDIMTKPPRRSDEMLITPWVFFRYMVVGVYVGVATVGAFVSWFMYDKFMGIDLSQDGHSTVTWAQLVGWQSCSTWSSKEFNPALSFTTAGGGTVAFSTPCDYFDEGKVKAMTLSLSVIVAIEMFNALNALSEDASLLVMPPWTNPYLLVAITLSISLHCVIMYVPFLASIFQIVPLSWPEWQLVILWSFPVILIDEVLKLLARVFFGVKKVKVD